MANPLVVIVQSLYVDLRMCCIVALIDLLLGRTEIYSLKSPNCPNPKLETTVDTPVTAGRGKGVGVLFDLESSVTLEELQSPYRCG